MILLVATFTTALLVDCDEVIQTWPATHRYLESLGYVNSQLFGGSKGKFKKGSFIDLHLSKKVTTW